MPSDELREVMEVMEDMDVGIDTWTEFLTDLTIPEQLDQEIESAIASELERNFEKAMQVIPEYNDNEELRTHLILNLQTNKHVEVSNGEVIRIINVDAIGDYNDVRAGQEAAWELSPMSPNQNPYFRSLFWKAIYLGDAGVFLSKGIKWDNFDPAMYDWIMDARMGAWGDKAPYWMFIEWGTIPGGQSDGTPYPQFSGEHPVGKTESVAGDIAKRAISDYIRETERELAKDADELFEGGRRYTKDGIERKVTTAWTRAFRQHGKLIRREYHVLYGGFTGRYEVIEE